MKTINGHGAKISFGCAMAAVALMAFSPTAARADRDDWHHNRGNHFGWNQPQNPHSNWSWRHDNDDSRWFHGDGDRDRDDQRWFHRDNDDRRWHHRRDRDRDWYKHHRRVWDRNRGVYIWIRI